MIGVRRRRGRNVEVGELCDEQPDRLRIRALVHAVQRLAVARREQLRDRLVREDHELLHECVRLGLRLALRRRDASLPVELERHLGRLDAQRAAREALLPQLLCARVEPAQQVDVLELFLSREHACRLPVGQARVAADHGAVEGRLAAVERQLHGHGEAVDVRTEAAEIVRELVRQHRRDAARHVRREAAARAPRSSGVPASTKYDTSAMWT